MVRHAGFLTDADVFSLNEIGSDPLYANILIPRGYGSGVATAIPFPNGDSIVINIEGAAALGPFAAASVGLLDDLRPHLTRSALISARLAFERARTAVETLSGLGLAACAISRACTVLVANREFDAKGSPWTTRGSDRRADRGRSDGREDRDCRRQERRDDAQPAEKRARQDRLPPAGRPGAVAGAIDTARRVEVATSPLTHLDHAHRGTRELLISVIAGMGGA